MHPCIAELFQCAVGLGQIVSVEDVGGGMIDCFYEKTEGVPVTAGTKEILTFTERHEDFRFLQVKEKRSQSRTNWGIVPHNYLLEDVVGFGVHDGITFLKPFLVPARQGDSTGNVIALPLVRIRKDIECEYK